MQRTGVPAQILEKAWKAYKEGGEEGIKNFLLEQHNQKKVTPKGNGALLEDKAGWNIASPNRESGEPDEDHKK